MLQQQLNNVRAKAPLVHNITNYVTVNDCANILLAIGASPIMADDAAEVEEITTLCAALNLNLGTLNARTIPAMLLAGKRAAALGRPLVLDPVGAGASTLRTDTARRFLRELRPTVVRGNASEIRTLALGAGATQGVDASLEDTVTEENLEESLLFLKDFAARHNTVVALTGAIDVVCDGQRAYVIRNGHPMMSRVTGTGCMLSALTAAFLAANPETPLEAAAAAVCAMGLCGETGAARLNEGEGSATLRVKLIDAIFCLTGEALEQGGRYELR